MTAPAAGGPGWYPDPNNAGAERFWDGTQWTSQFRQARDRSLGGLWNGLGKGTKVAIVAAGTLLVLFIVVFGFTNSSLAPHSDSWHQGYENAELAKAMYKHGGLSKREACRGALTIPASLNHDDVIEGCIAALGG